MVGVLFAMLGRDIGTAATFAEMVRHGPSVLAALPAAPRDATAARLGNGFSAAFLAVAAFAALNAVLAWTLPLRRL